MNKFMRIIALVCVAGIAMPAFCPPKQEVKPGNANPTRTEQIYPNLNNPQQSTAHAQPQPVFQGLGYQLGDSKDRTIADLQKQVEALKKNQQPKPLDAIKKVNKKDVQEATQTVFAPYVDLAKEAWIFAKHLPTIAGPAAAGFLAHKWYSAPAAAKSVTAHFVEAACSVWNATKEVLTLVKHPNVYMPMSVTAAIIAPWFCKKYVAPVATRVVKYMFTSDEDQTTTAAK